MASSSVRSAVLTALLVLALIKRALRRRLPLGRKALTNGKSWKATDVAGPAASPGVRHNKQRQAAIAFGGPQDHAGNVVVVPQAVFDLTKTIFKSLPSVVARYFIQVKIGNDLFWSDTVVDDIDVAYRSIPVAPSVDKAILDFMAEECNFSMEHADGSFMDHLMFCHNYSAAHYKEHSPRVLFLHSIMGVGTNCFPMAAEKIPKLQTMLTEFEFKHVEVFPSVLRLILSRALLDELSANIGRLDKLERVDLHRVIDNKPVTMSGQDLWVHLNFQVIHLMDFLPAAGWVARRSDPLFRTFLDLAAFMQRAGRLRARVDFDHPIGELDLQGQPLTLGACLLQSLPGKLLLKIQVNEIRKFSRAIRHSLDYKLHWAS